MGLNGEQFRLLHEALLDAFSAHDQLKFMVRTGLDENLEKIAAKKDLNAVVMDLIDWVQAQGRLEELVSSARVSNPGNAKLHRFAENVLNSVVEATGAGSRRRKRLINVPPRNGYFVGRENVLESVHVSLTAENATALTQAIIGLGALVRHRLQSSMFTASANTIQLFCGQMPSR